MYKVKYGMAPRCVSELFTIKSTHQRLRNCDFELPRCAFRDLSFVGQRSVVSSETWQASTHSKNIAIHVSMISFVVVFGLPVFWFLIYENYSPKWRWLVVINTDTEVNNCFTRVKNHGFPWISMENSPWNSMEV